MSDYTSVSGGALRMKGASSKPKKKKKPKPEQFNPDTVTDSTSERAKDRDETGENTRETSRSDRRSRSPSREPRETSRDRRDDRRSGPSGHKTEAELRHDAQRKKRLDEKLKREGVKTHKEKVEDLNRYLSRLSEHHDMPKIGPG